MPNKFKATWISASSIGSFLQCPRAYQLSNIKGTDGRKISTVSPYLTLGICVHDVLEPLAWFPKEERLKDGLVDKFLDLFNKNLGKKGGFKSEDQESQFRNKGVDMMENVESNPNFLIKPALRLLQDRSELPWLWLSEKEEIILSGRPDWIEYREGKLWLYDFKTGQHNEKEESLQLPIYNVMARHFKKDPVAGAAYWYIARDTEPLEKTLPDYKKTLDKLLELGIIIKEARAKGQFDCPSGGCRQCEPLERIVKGEGEMLGYGTFGQKLYYL